MQAAGWFFRSDNVLFKFMSTAFSKLIVQGVFPNDEHSNELDLSTADWVYLPLERDDKLAKPLRDLTCGPVCPRPSSASCRALWSCPCTWSTLRASRGF